MIHFLSDLHLSPDTPGINRLFLDYLAGEARTATHIFILGDLFEAWPGDDTLDDPEDALGRTVVDGLRALSDAGTEIAVQHGNRDFLLGSGFAERAGAVLLSDPYLLVLPDARFVLSHGDMLCTDDAEYQAFRQQVRMPVWQQGFLSKPLAERKAIAAALRLQSEDSKRAKSMQAMDASSAAIENLLHQHGGATLIHGHTHRPDRHEHRVDDTCVERWVLADWHENHGEYLAWDGARLTRHALLPAA